MPVRGTITYVGMDGMKKADIRRLVKQELLDSVDFWHSEFLPMHFKRGAKQKYGYKDREKRYNERKRRKKGHTRPLEFSGQMKRELLRRVRLTGTSKKATGSMSAPRYMYKYQPGQPDKASEVTAVTQRELQQMAFQMDRKLQKKMNRNRKKRTVRV